MRKSKEQEPREAAGRPTYPLDEDPVYTEAVERLLNDDPVLAEGSFFESLLLRIMNNIKAAKRLADAARKVADAAIPAAQKGVASGVATLNAGGKLAQRVDYASLDDAPTSLPSSGGNAETANTLKTARSIAIGGGATGTATNFNGGENIVIPVTALDMGAAKTGVLAVARGGTGQTTATAIRNSLGLGNTTGPLPVEDGGTGAGDAAAARAALGVAYGTAAGTVCQGDDARLTDARTPTAHTHVKANITDFPATMPPSAHTHAAGEIIGGVLPVANGGTGSVDAAAALSNLGGVAASSKGAANGVASLDGSGKVTAAQAAAGIVSKTASATLSVSDAGRFLMVNSGAAVTVTIPTNAAVALPLGAEIEIMRYGAGAVSITAASGVTIVSVDGALTIGERYGIVAIKQIAANVWALSGGLE